MSVVGTRHEIGGGLQTLPNIFRRCVRRKYFGRRTKRKATLNSGVGKSQAIFESFRYSHKEWLFKSSLNNFYRFLFLIRKVHLMSHEAFLKLHAHNLEMKPNLLFILFVPYSVFDSIIILINIGIIVRVHNQNSKIFDFF